MTISYDKTWEVLNDLEESFSRIITFEKMVDDLMEAVNNNDQNSILELAHAMTAFFPVYLRQYDKASRRAWNNTVIEVAKTDNPYKSTNGTNINYDEVVKYLESDTSSPYVFTKKHKTED